MFNRREWNQTGYLCIICETRLCDDHALTRALNDFRCPNENENRRRSRSLRLLGARVEIAQERDQAQNLKRAQTFSVCAHSSAMKSISGLMFMILREIKRKSELDRGTYIHAFGRLGWMAVLTQKS